MAMGFVVVGLIASALVVSTAASLGGIGQADLFGWAATVNVPLPPAFDHFDDCSGALNGDVDVVGNSWTSHSGNWRCRSGQSLARARQSMIRANATVDVGQSDRIIVSTYVSRVSDRRNQSGPGLSLLSDGNYHMYIIYERDLGRMALGKFDSSGNAVIATAPIPDRNTIALEVSIDQPDLTVTVDGTTLITYTMDAGEVATFGSNIRFGMEADRDVRSRFDWFRVDAIP